MTNMTRVSFVAPFLLLALAAAPASAQTCVADSDCLQGFACVVSGTSAPPACKGTGCPADASASDPVDIKSCEPKPCTVDADCGTGMVCYEQKSTSCSGSGGTACAPNTKCDAGPIITVETCTTTTRDICAFKWQLPCNADGDCGDGFVCQPSVTGCGTSTRSGSSGPTGGAATPADTSFPPAADAGAPECTTSTSFPGACRPKATTCTADGDCPGGWTCTAIGTPQPVTVGVPITRGDASAAQPPPADAGGSSIKVCIGPYGIGAPTRGIDVATGGEAANSGHAGGSSGSGGAVPPTAGGATGGTTGGPGASPQGSSSSGGCTVAPAGGGLGALLIGLAAFAVVLGRRRSGR